MFCTSSIRKASDGRPVGARSPDPYRSRHDPMLIRSSVPALRRDDLVLTGRRLRFLGQTFPCSLGRSGPRTEKREGDSSTPKGTHRIVDCLYRPDRLVRPNAWAAPIRLGDLWCDDSESLDYNHLVRAPCNANHETLWRSDPLYDIILVTDWNWPDAVPGRGSAIFLHQWRKPRYPTEGCIALGRGHLIWIAGRVLPGARLIVS